MNNLNRGKITKSQFVELKRNSRYQHNTNSAYDLNENGGFVADKDIILATF